jgi:putative Mg2+ transporter-C (MgtC) family protein
VDLTPTSADVVLRMSASVVLGGALGLEREWKRKPAGLRTHMLVCLGCTTFTLILAEMYSRLLASPSDVARVDPLRVVEAIAGGIGFLGAGSILRSRGSVEGLTTAGSLWFVGAIGVAVGGGHMLIAGTGVVLALVVLAVIGAVERRFSPED